MKLRIALLLITLLITFSNEIRCQERYSCNETHGPASGSLLIAGGGMLSDTIINRFINLAGGIDARFVVIPTAAGDSVYDESAGNLLRSRGVKNITILHTADRDTANSERFVKPITEAGGVWFGGGRQWHLVDSYLGTLTEKALRDLLDRGGVIGGSSAGATVQGSFLVRGDTKNNQIMMGDHKAGMAFVSCIAIDQHVLARGRQFDMYEVLKANPGILGIGIDENTAVVVKADTMEVIGASYVLIYDGTYWSREGGELKNLPPKDIIFYMLRKGDRYDLHERKVLR